MSRIAKQLVNKRSGRTASYGLVLEELLQSRGQTFELAPSSTKKSKTRPHSGNPRSRGVSPTNNPEDPVHDLSRTIKVKGEELSKSLKV